jgi:DNA repair protein RadC
LWDDAYAPSVATPKIKDWPEEERPREKLMHRGADALSDAELLAIFLRTGTPGRTAIDVGEEMIKAAGGSLARMAPMTVKELRKLAKGVGLAKACEMAAAFEVGKRLARQTAQSEPLGTPEKIYGFMGPLLQNLPRESLRVVLLDTRHRLLHTEEVSLGTINESLAHPREILRPAISHGAYAFVLVHNHPSGDPTPSEADRALTRRIREAADLLQIHLLDHVIIGRERPGAPPYFSFKEHGLL